MFYKKGFIDTIKNIYGNDSEILSLLDLDEVSGIRKILDDSNERISPEEVILAYENNDFDKLVLKAKKLKELKKLYFELCNEYYRQKILYYEQKDKSFRKSL